MIFSTYIYPIFFLPLLIISAQVQELSLSSRLLDSVLQDYAFRAFVRPRTGVVYDGNVPSNLTGIKVSAMRLRSGSFRKRGYHGFREFDLPSGIFEYPYVQRVIFVYQNMGNWSDAYYSLPGFTYLAPVLGLLAYSASDLTGKDLPELDIRASDKPILIRFGDVGSGSARCVFFDLFGSVEFNNVVNGSVCESFKQGHFGIVVEGVSPAPSPGVENPIPGIHGGGISGGGGGGRRRRLWVIGGCVVGGVLLLVVVGLLVRWVRKCVRRERIERMETVAEGGVHLGKATVGSAKMPVAVATRTRPFLEKEYVP